MRAPSSRTLGELLAEVAERHPDRTGMIWRDQAIAHAGWHAAAAAVAGALRSLELARHDVVGLLACNRPEWLYTAFGCAILGSPVAAFNTWSRPWDLDYMLGHSGLKVLVTQDRFRSQDYLAVLKELVPELWQGAPGQWRSARYPHMRHVVVIGEEVPPGACAFSDLFQHGGESPVSHLAPGEGASAADILFIVYTSGSTARPKAVPLQHYAAIENGFNIGERQGLTPDDRVWVPVPLFWSYGAVNALTATLSHAATLVLQEAFEPGEALEIIERHRCTVAYTLPHITRSLVEHPQFRPERTRSLRTGVTIGMPEDVRRAAEVLGIAGICNIYGSTETYGNCCVTPAALPLARRMTCQGTPLPGVTIRIANPETGADQPPGEIGEIWVKGYLSPGYLGSDQANREAYTPDGFYRTGDLGYLNGEGCIHFHGRAVEMIKTGGINVSPLELEEFLSTHPAVRQVAVVGVPDPVQGEVVVAFVVAEPGAELTPAGLRAYCRDRIAGFKVPAHIYLCSELPRTDTGKLARRQLRDWGGAGHGPP